MGLSQPKPWVGYPHANFNRDSMGMCQLVLGLLDSLVTYFGASFELALFRGTTIVVSNIIKLVMCGGIKEGFNQLAY